MPLGPYDRRFPAPVGKWMSGLDLSAARCCRLRLPGQWRWRQSRVPCRRATTRQPHAESGEAEAPADSLFRTRWHSPLFFRSGVAVTADAKVCAMQESSIYQLLVPDEPPGGPDPLGVLVGQRIRDRRRALGMTQSDLAGPYTKSYVSAVENGRVMPSLRTLWFIAGRLGVGVGDLVDSVKPLLTPEYNLRHEPVRACRLNPPPRRRRPA